MKVVESITGAVLAFPVLALLAIALGPVSLLILAVAGTGLAFFVAVDLFVGTAYVLKSVGSRLAHALPDPAQLIS